MIKFSSAITRICNCTSSAFVKSGTVENSPGDDSACGRPTLARPSFSHLESAL